ncbi:MAG TPA: copper transporter [Solirubrobacterales bacterium]|nr:copper transporter [Solirubrobacterales bacterium]
MGYSGRYHAASLAAVFLALAIGILIGVGLGDNIVSGTTKGLEQSLKSDLSAARGRADELQSQLNRHADFEEQAFPALTGNVLEDDRVAVVALGALPDDLKGDVQAVVGPDSPSGAKLAEVAVVREPPDLAAVAGAAPKGSEGRHVRRDRAALTAVAKRVGHALVVGGPTFKRFRGAMLDQVSGRPGGIDAVIVIRARPEDLEPHQAAETDALESGLLDALEGRGAIPVVGVERSDTDASSIGFFNSAGLTATVDSVDLISGRVALVYALNGSEGNYGIKATADRLLPGLRHPRPPASVTVTPR